MERWLKDRLTILGASSVFVRMLNTYPSLLRTSPELQTTLMSYVRLHFHNLPLSAAKLTISVLKRHKPHLVLT